MSIQKGDLVMVVKPVPCCMTSLGIGAIFKVKTVEHVPAICVGCKSVVEEPCAYFDNEEGYELSRLKKIDPPADGDSVPTRQELEVQA